MRFRYLTYVALSILSLAAAGCTCVQGMPGGCGGGGCSTGTCDTGGCRAAGLGSFLSCRGGCGDVYVDEWISEPPEADNCGYECGGCGHCEHCRPVRGALRALWGHRYQPHCTNGLMGPPCETGCSECGGTSYGGEVYSDGTIVDESASPEPIPLDPTLAPEGPLKVEPEAVPPPPEAVPTPAPDIDKGTARRLNPASRHHSVRQASRRVTTQVGRTTKVRR